MGARDITVEEVSTREGLAHWRLDCETTVCIEDVAAWLSEHRSAIDDALRIYGALLIRNSIVATASDFQHVVGSVVPNLRDYVGGTSPRDRVEGKVMTATRVPDDWSIILHQEMAYTRDPPTHIAFYCQRPASSGRGQTLLGNMRKVAPKLDPAVRTRCERLGFRLRRTLPSQRNVHLKPGVQKPWSEVLGVRTRRQAEEVLRKKDWAFQWIADDALVLLQEAVPALRKHPDTGESIWCNQAHFHPPACMMEWAKQDGRSADFAALLQAKRNNPELLDNILFGNGDEVPDEVALHLYHTVQSVAFDVELEKNDILMIDNLVCAHGRRAYVDDRQLFVLLADRDLRS